MSRHNLFIFTCYSSTHTQFKVHIQEFNSTIVNSYHMSVPPPSHINAGMCIMCKQEQKEMMNKCCLKIESLELMVQKEIWVDFKIFDFSTSFIRWHKGAKLLKCKKMLPSVPAHVLEVWRNISFIWRKVAKNISLLQATKSCYFATFVTSWDAQKKQF